MSGPAKLFLSFAREDEALVSQLYDQLVGVGLVPWMSTRNILPGEDWENSIWRAVREVDFFIACLSTSSVAKRGFLQKEIRQALGIWNEKLEDDIYLIPLRLEECPVPDVLSKFEYVDLFSLDGFDKLIKAISAGLERQIRPKAVMFAKNTGFINLKNISETDPGGIAYSIDIQYPQIEGTQSEVARDVNSRIAEFAMKMGRRFKAGSIAEAMEEGARRFRIEHKMFDSLDVKFNVPYVKDKFLCIRFNIWSYCSGAAHPNSQTRTFNFLLAPFEHLDFVDLFRWGSAFLNKISDFCVADLHRQVAGERGIQVSEFQKDSWIIRGAGPDIGNFESFVLTAAGLLIVFDPYQVGSYAEGRKEVVVPYDELRQLLRAEILQAVE